MRIEYYSFDELLKADGLSDRQSADANHGAVNSGGVLMRTNNRLQHLRIGTNALITHAVIGYEPQTGDYFAHASKTMAIAIGSGSR